MTEMVLKNSCSYKTSVGELHSSIPSYFSRITSSNQTENSHVNYSVVLVPASGKCILC